MTPVLHEEPRLLLRSTSRSPIVRTGEKLAGRGSRPQRIRCPLCLWQPRRTDTWLCSHCGYTWNTFDTHGLCPGCGHQWLETACLRCGEWSRHEDWYEGEPV